MLARKYAKLQKIVLTLSLWKYLFRNNGFIFMINLDGSI